MSTCGCGPQQCDPNNEPVASELENFKQWFWGSVSKSCVNGEVVWNTPCDLASTGLACIPMLPGEGFACFFIRVLSEVGIFPAGAWSSTVSYCKNQFVTYNGNAYIALQTSINQNPATATAYWQQYMVGVTGPQGAQGAQGITGAQGAQGVQGANGSNGAQGSQGAQGTTGSQGAQGTAGDKSYGGDFPYPLNQSYTLDQSAPIAKTITNLVIQASAGAGTASVKINGTAVTGLSGITVDSTARTYAATGLNSVSAGQLVSISFDTITSPLTDVGYTIAAS